MAAASLHALGATNLVRLVSSRQLTSSEIAVELLERIEEREPSLHAWQFLDPSITISQAMSDRTQGALAGVPVGVKDLFDTADMPTTYGSPIYAHHRPVLDASAVARLRQSGAVIMGKTVTTQFAAVTEAAMTVNPYSANRTPGGSSSGSAAAVADRMVPVAIGTQTAGSVIRPAAYCGIFGFKPTFGSIGRTGVKAVSPSLDTIGIFARNAEDLNLVYGVLVGRDPDDASTAWTASFNSGEWRHLEAPPRIAYVRTHSWNMAEPSMQRTLDRVAAMLEHSGASLGEVALPTEFDELVRTSAVVLSYEVARALGAEYKRHKDMLPSSLISLIERGLRMDDAKYKNAIEMAAVSKLQLTSLFREYDAILTPATLGEAPLIETTGDPLFCRAWTQLGNPATTVPGMRGPNGLPIGIQLICDHQQDDLLLRISDWVSRQLPELPPPSAARPSIDSVDQKLT